VAGGLSERDFCRQANVARSTLRDAAERQLGLDAPDAIVAFFTSPEGEMLLRRIVFAAHFVLTLLGCGGVQLVCTFLRLSGLSAFVGSSYGAQQRLNSHLLATITAFGQAERERLGATMSKKRLWLCEDETFFPQMLLVAMDALSGFLVVERYAEQRDASTWTEAVSEGLGGLNVEVLGVTADQAKGIVAHATQSLGVSAIPDLFHVQHDLSKGCCAALASRVRAAEKALAEIEDKGPEEPGREAAREILDQARERQGRMAAVLEGMSEAAHPYELRTGEKRSADEVSAEWSELLDEAEAVADEAELPEASRASIAKARRALGAVAAGIKNFHRLVQFALWDQRLPREIEWEMEVRVLPSLYLQATARRARDPQQRHDLEEQARTLLQPLQDEASSGMMRLSEAAVAQLLSQGKEWVSWYVRASSCVEGRNGQLSLHHHSLHGLGAPKLAALTVLHNFWSQREDGSTAAERLFDQKPQDLFEWLLDTMPDLPRSAAKRPHRPPTPYLN
jgi:hypothetical protein